MRGRNSRSDEEQEMLSKTQVDAILAEIQGQTQQLKSMSPEAAARVSSLASSVPFAPGHLSHVLKQIGRIQSKGSGGARTWTQQYATPQILSYFTKAEWELFEGAGANVAMEHLIHRLVQLGYVRLSETCKAWCTGLLLHMSQQANATASVKQRWLDLFKTQYARRARPAKKTMTLQPPATLPEPSVLWRDHHDLYARVFPRDPPSAPLIDMMRVELPRVDCRGGKDLLRMPDASKRTTADAGGGRVLEQLVALQTDHLKLLQSTLGAPQQVQAPRSLSALASGPMQAMRPLTMSACASGSSSSTSFHALIDAPLAPKTVWEALSQHERKMGR